MYSEVRLQEEYIYLHINTSCRRLIKTRQVRFRNSSFAVFNNKYHDIRMFIHIFNCVLKKSEHVRKYSFMQQELALDYCHFQRNSAKSRI